MVGTNAYKRPSQTSALECQIIGPKLPLQALTFPVPRFPQPMPDSAVPFRLRLAVLATLMATLLALPGLLRAQGGIVYAGSDLDALPTLVSPEIAARLLARSYPASLKQLGVTGTVQVQFIVSSNGKVEPASVQVMSSTAPQFATAARSIVEQIEFRPGEVKGLPVRALVLLPMIYK